MARQDIDTSLPMVGLQPAAAPVDTYVRPAVDTSAGSGLMDLAKSLRGFAAPLDDYVSAQEQKQATNDQVKAQADFVRNNQQGFNDAVSQGLIPASASPAYVNAYKKAQGDVAGGNLEQEAFSAYSQSPAKNSTDPNAFQSFMSDFLKSRIGTTDPEVLKGLMPRILATQRALQQQHLQDQDTQIRQGSQNMLGAQTSQAIDGAHSAGLASPDGPNYDAAFGAMEQNRVNFTNAGMTPQEADKAEFETVTQKAIQLNDPKVLDFFNRKVPGQDYTYKDTPEGLKAYGEAVTKLDVISRQGKVEQHQAQEAADKAAKNKSESDALSIISVNPRAPLPDELNSRGKQYNGTWDAQVAGWRKTLSDASNASDPVAVATVNRQITQDPTNGPQHVIDALTQGSLSPQDFQTTWKFAQDFQQHGGEWGKILQNPKAISVMGAIKDRTAPGDTDFQMRPDTVTDDGFKAQDAFQQQLIQWAQQNPEDAKDPAKTNKAISDIRDGILESISGDTITGGKYTPPGSTTAPAPDVPGSVLDTVRRSLPPSLGGTAGGPAQPTPGAAPQAPTAPAAPTVAAPAATPPVTPPAQPAGPSKAEVDGWYNGLDPVIKQAVDGAILARHPADPDAYRGKLMQRFKANSGQTAPAAAGQQSNAGGPMFMAAQNPPGLVEAGNIDLTKRPSVKLPDGSIATVRSMSFQDKENGPEILIPTVSPDGKLWSNKDAIANYHASGQNLGKFKDPDAADAYAQALHLQQEQMYVKPSESGGTAPDGTPVNKTSFTPQGGTSAFSSDKSPGEIVDAALNDPHGALSAIQSAVDQQSSVDQASEAFDKAYSTPTQESFSSVKNIPIGQLPSDYSMYRDKGNSPKAAAYQQAGIGYLEKELGPVGADIVAANLQHESRFDPNAVNKDDAGPGLDSNGVAQWNRERLRRMHAFSEAITGKSYGSLSTPEKFQSQLAFVVHEIRTNPNYAAALEDAKRHPSLAGQIFGRVYEGYKTTIPGNDSYRNKNFLTFQRRRGDSADT